MLEEGKYYLYRHIRLDKNEPFYIGIATKRREVKGNIFKSVYFRAYRKSGRNKIWNNIINLTDYSVEILFESDNYEFIKNKEKEFILLYGRKDLKTGCLANRCDGGEGNAGKIITEGMRLNMRMGQINSIKTLKKGTKLPDWWKNKISESVKGENNHMYGRIGKDHPNTKRVINIDTKKVFESITDAADTTKYSMKYVAGMLNSDKQNLTPFIFEKTYLKKGEDYCRKITNQKPKNPVGNSKKVINTETKEVHNSAKEVAKLLGLHPATVRKSIKERKINYKYIYNGL